MPLEGSFGEEPPEFRVPEGMWDDGHDTYLSAADFQGVKDWRLPTDDPILWDKEECTRAEMLSMMFSAEYVFDWDPRRALVRMGVPQEQVKALAKQYMTFPLVQRFIKVRTKSFKRKQAVTVDTALALVHRDASDFSIMSNPLARVKAQATLVKVLGMEPEGSGGKNGGGGTNVTQNGGVMVVPGLLDGKTWEELAADSQENLMKQA